MISLKVYQFREGPKSGKSGFLGQGDPPGRKVYRPGCGYTLFLDTPPPSEKSTFPTSSHVPETYAVTEDSPSGHPALTCGDWRHIIPKLPIKQVQAVDLESAGGPSPMRSNRTRSRRSGNTSARPRPPARGRRPIRAVRDCLHM